jgi:hypothetical protein
LNLRRGVRAKLLAAPPTAQETAESESARKALLEKLNAIAARLMGAGAGQWVRGGIGWSVVGERQFALLTHADLSEGLLVGGSV